MSCVQRDAAIIANGPCVAAIMCLPVSQLAARTGACRATRVWLGTEGLGNVLVCSTLHQHATVGCCCCSAPGTARGAAASSPRGSRTRGRAARAAEAEAGSLEAEYIY